MLNSTLCYITRGDEVLMLHRVKKKNDVNKDIHNAPFKPFGRLIIL